MADFFLDLVNISITAGYIILAVILLRLIFKKIPKKFICLLWGLAGIRLVFPFSIESALSLIPSTETITPNSHSGYGISVNSGIPAVDRPVNDFLISSEMASTDAITYDIGDMLVSVASIAWAVGIFAILLYGIISYIKVKKSVKTAVLLKDNVWQSESVVSPFILGVFKPKIYIPFNMDEETRNYVVAHENAHLKRRDHWIKPLGFLILAVYWFNPLVWIAYTLLCRDIEAACDEKVISGMNGDTRKEYASALLECAVNRRRIAACPLAFGEVSVKNRIKNVMNYKKPAFWVIIFAVAACIVAAVCFLTNPETHEYYDSGNRLKITVSADGETKETKILQAQIGNKVTLSNGTKLEIILVDLQRDEIEVKFSGTPLYGDSSSVPARGLLLTLSSSHNHTTDNGETVVVEYVKMQSLDDAITAAIMENSRGSDDAVFDYECSYHEVLATESAGEASSNEIDTVTAYVTAAYGKYILDNGEAVLVSGYSSPLALTFSADDTGYALLDYWMAEDGSRYTDSIRNKFPSIAAEIAIKDPYSAAEQCQAKADDYFRENASKINYRYDVAEAKAYTTSDEVEIMVGDIALDQKNLAVWMRLTNSSDKTVLTGRPFQLYRYENDEWVSCETTEDLAWTLEAIMILAGQSREESCNLGFFDISKNGYYRLVKDFSIEGETHTANVEFVVDTNDSWEKLEVPAGESMLVPDSLYTVYENRVGSKHSESWFEFEKAANNAFVEYDETVEPVDGVIIKSKADFDKFIKEMSKHFVFSDSDSDTDFADTAEKFDEEFFKNNSLIIMHVREITYSITHALSDITRHHQMAPEESRRESDGYALSFQVHREIPYMDGELMSERFITVAMDNAAIGDVHSVYITYGEDMRKPKAVYRYSDYGKALVGATVTLYSDTEIMFNYSLLSSYIPHGTYTVKHGKLVMKTDDGRYTYTFIFKGDSLVFDAAHSSELPEYNYGDGTKFKPVPNGAVFEKD